MKTYLVTSQTNYGTTIHVVNASDGVEAVKLAQTYGRSHEKAWPDATAEEINCTTPGVVLADFRKG